MRVSVVPKMLSRNVAETSTMFHTFIMPFFSCIMTECKKAVAVIQGISEAFSTGPNPNSRPNRELCTPSPYPKGCRWFERAR